MIIKKDGDRKFFAVKKDDISGLFIKFFMTAEDLGPSFSMWFMEFEPLGYAKMHSHKEEHYLYVLKGVCAFKTQVSGEIIANEGDCVFIPSCEEHEIKNPGHSVLKMVSFMPVLKGASGKSTTPCD